MTDWIGDILLIIAAALFVGTWMAHWESKAKFARIHALRVKDFEGTITPKEERELKDLING